MKFTISELLRSLPGTETPLYPEGEPFVTAFAHGTMSVELYAPTKFDIQNPHEQDELYFIHSGHGDFIIGDVRHNFEPGTAFFVPAGIKHHFENFSPNFSTWVVFWGALGGE